MGYMVNMHNYEEYILLYTDGELDERGTEELMLFMKEHPELQDELNMYNQLKLVPDEALVFAGKEQLLKQEPRTIRLVPTWMYGAVAGLALIVVVSLLITHQPHNPTPQTIVKNETKKPSGNINPQPTDTDTASAQQMKVIASAQPIKNNIVKTTIHQQNEKSSTNLTRAQKEAIPRQGTEDIAQLESTNIIAPATIAPSLETTEELSILQPEILALNEKSNSGNMSDLMDKLNMEQEKKEGLYEVKKQVTSGISKLQHLPQNLKETTFSLRLGKKEIVNINF